MGGGSRYQHAIQSWAVTGKSADDAWYSYYLVEIDSILFTSVDGTFKLREYNYDCRLVGTDGLIAPSTELVAVTPDTTQGSTSYTTSMSESFSASGGFFGADPTATIGGSVTFGHSVSRSIPDIGINNRSITSDGQNASWTLQVAGEAPAQHAAMEFTAQMLFRVPTKPGPQPAYGVKFEFNSLVFDDDENGTDYHDRTAAIMMPRLETTKLVEWGDRGMYCVLKPEIIKMVNPAMP
ncbi:hypothetical protein B5V03_36450 [Bradyrhizobium betae]|uniref:Uncharacterized protein n=2 Tax=Bradyrhizobium betae TaxID=244734 RepID=A0A4Q1ULG2_9BRAD|nr:hypothetical protein B5V03_36450 [Bradyrhizobium betae]